MRTAGISTYLMITYVFFISCSKQNTGNDLAELNIAGKLKTLKESRHNATENMGHIQKKELNLTHVILFNLKGNISEESYYFSNGALFYRLAFFYNKKDY